MMPKLKNIIIFVVVGAIFVLIYIFFIKQPASPENLVSSSGVPSPGVPGVAPMGAPMASPLNQNAAVTQEFLTLLLSVKNLKLNDAIFTDNAFISLVDSPVDLTPDGTEGRINPFAPIGSDPVTVVPPPAEEAEATDTEN